MKNLKIFAAAAIVIAAAFTAVSCEKTYPVNNGESVALTNVTLPEKTMTLTVGETGDLRPIFYPGFATNQKVTWTSSDESIATVADTSDAMGTKGTVTAVAAGTATITVISDEGKFEAKCELTVEPAKSANTIVDFESAELNADGILLGNYTEDGLTFTHNAGEGYWSGFAFSNKTDMTTPGYANQYSAYNAVSTKFAVAYIYNTNCSFEAGVEKVIHKAEFVNSTYAYLAIKDGNDGAEKPYVKGPFADGDWFKLAVNGFNAAGTKTGTVDIYLADYRDGKTFIMTDWTGVDLSVLGKVNKLTFEISSSDSSVYEGVASPNTPQYFCMDNLEYGAE